MNDVSMNDVLMNDILMNDVLVKENVRIGEKYYHAKHKSGLDIYVIPRKLSTSYAIMCTRYGSVDNRFKISADADITSVPDGIAHYLEHKMFENADGVDTFKKFAKYGASANAFTSTDVTAYLFSCTENFTENLKILLDYVTHPYFTDENVERERGIIAQEIRGRDDYPDFVLYRNLLNALYRDSQIKIDVAGTVESISHINAETLYKCYNVFYNLSNMFLCVSGDVKIEEVLSCADEILPITAPDNIIRSYNYDGKAPVKRRIFAEFEIAKPMFLVGVKDDFPFGDAKTLLRRSLTMQLLTETLFGNSSEFSTEVYESGLIDELETGYSAGGISAMFMFGGESDDPEKAYGRFSAYIEEQKRKGLSKEDFELARRVKYAEYVRSFERTDAIAETFAMGLIKGYDWFDVGDVMADITSDEAETLLNEIFDEKNYAMSVVNPLKKDLGDKK